jgi:hypothetical protein
MPQLGPFPVIGPNVGQSPTLIPNFSRQAGGVTGRGVAKQSPQAYLSANPRVAATATVTVSGTPTNGDTASVTIACPIFNNPALAYANGAVTATYTQVTGDSLAAVAEGLATAINESALGAFLLAEASEAVITLSWPGPVGNFATLTVASTGVTLTKSAGTLAGGSGPTYVWNNFDWTASHQVMSFWMGNFYNMSGVLAGVVNGAQPVQ